MLTRNLYSNLPTTVETAERIDPLLTQAGVRFERIISTGQSSPPGFWYDQARAEWVAVLQGAAHLRFADEDEVRQLSSGDWLYIDPHRRHRIEWTDPQQVTVWLAVHFDAP